MSPATIVGLLEARGFAAVVDAGRYSKFPGTKGLVAAAANLVISGARPLALTLAPYYVVVAERP